MTQYRQTRNRAPRQNKREQKMDDRSETREQRETPYDVPAVAEALNLPKSWVYNNAEKLGGVKFGKYWRFSPARVRQMLEPETR
jgi:hypothetical protein